MKEQQWLCPVKPEEIPKEYNYVAQDQCGAWCAYQDEPIPLEELCAWDDFKYVLFLCEGDYNVNWRKTLTKIPR